MSSYLQAGLRPVKEYGATFFGTVRHPTTALKTIVEGASRHPVATAVAAASFGAIQIARELPFLQNQRAQLSAAVTSLVQKNATVAAAWNNPRTQQVFSLFATYAVPVYFVLVGIGYLVDYFQSTRPQQMLPQEITPPKAPPLPPRTGSTATAALSLTASQLAGPLELKEAIDRDLKNRSGSSDNTAQFIHTLMDTTRRTMREVEDDDDDDEEDSGKPDSTLSSTRRTASSSVHRVDEQEVTNQVQATLTEYLTALRSTNQLSDVAAQHVANVLATVQNGPAISLAIRHNHPELHFPLSQESATSTRL